MASIQPFETEVWKPRLDESGNQTGYLTYDSQRSMGELLDHLVEVLKAETYVDDDDTMSLYSAIDSFGLGFRRDGRFSRSDDIPRCRWYVAYVVAGSNEGHYVHVDGVGPLAERSAATYDMDQRIPLFQGKTFFGLRAGLAVVAALTAVFQDR